jgi:hypothetical protein
MPMPCRRFGRHRLDVPVGVCQRDAAPSPPARSATVPASVRPTPRVVVAEPRP